MYKINVLSHFSSAHKLDDYDGQCKNLHGHNWKVRAGIECSGLDKLGLSVDFGIVKICLKEILAQLDHEYLNELKYFKKINPTSENIAQYIYKKMSQKLNSETCKVIEIELWESENSSIVYYE